MKIKLIIAVQVFALLLFNGNSVAVAEVTVYKNEASGLLTWNLKGQGFEIELIQLLPDFVRAIYAKHNFPKNEVERIAAFCVFGTILKNTSDKNMSYQVSDWRYQSAGNKAFAVKTKTQWLEEWRKAGILFSWTLLPDTGDFSVGDWQQGFTTIALPRETEFDLSFKWKIDDVAHSAVLKNIRCAPDSLAEMN